MALEASHPTEMVRVRNLNASDLTHIRAIAQQSPEAAHWSESDYILLLEDLASIALAIEIDGELAGFLIGKQVSDQAEVFNLVVKPAYRRKHVGSSLLSASLREFASRGAVYVYLEVRESNTAAIAFYRKHGFRTSGRRELYYRNPDEAALTMSRKLTG